MLILVPPSESKRPPPDHGAPVELEALSFPELTPTRARILDALIETSAGSDAFGRLAERPTMAGRIARNTRLLELPTRPARDVYAGPLHVGLDLASLTGATAAGAERSVVIASALWGALRPGDRIPAYRMRPWSNLVGIGRVEPTWRSVLPGLFSELLGPAGVVVDLRPPSFQSMGMPAGLGDRTVTIRVDQSAEDGRRIGDVVAKRTRGEAAHHLLASGTEPDDPDALADLMADRWPVRLAEPDRPGRPWTLTVTTSD